MKYKESDEGIRYMNVEFHARQAATYDESHTMSPLFELVVSGLRPKDRVLDLGTGTGFGAGLIEADKIIGIDISREMLEQNLEAERTQGVAGMLPFKPDSFDAVIVRSVLHHVLDVEQAIQEIARVARPGADIIIGNEPSGIGRVSQAVNRVKSKLGMYIGQHDSDWKTDLARQLGMDPNTLTNTVNVHSKNGVPIEPLEKHLHLQEVAQLRNDHWTAIATAP